MNNSKFENDVWVTFIYDDQRCIGRTMILPDGQEVISCVSESGQVGLCKFVDAQFPRKLNIVGTSQHPLNDGLKALKLKAHPNNQLSIMRDNQNLYYKSKSGDICMN